MEVEKLPADHYAVFKNVTKYSIWELEDLLSITGLNLKEFNKRKVALDKEDYRKYRKSSNSAGIFYKCSTGKYLYD